MRLQLRDQSAIERDKSIARLSPEPRIYAYMYDLPDVSVSSTSRDIVLGVPICLSPHSDTMYGDVAIGTRLRDLIPLHCTAI